MTIILFFATLFLIIALLFGLQMIIFIFKMIIEIIKMIAEDFLRFVSRVGRRISNLFNSQPNIPLKSNAVLKRSKQKLDRPPERLRDTKSESDRLQQTTNSYAPRTSYNSVVSDRFISECNRYVRQRDLEEEHAEQAKRQQFEAEKVEKQVTKEASTIYSRKQKFAEFKKKIKSYPYRDEEIDKYSNMVCSDHDKLADIEAPGIYQYINYLYSAAHIYIDYGYITSGMVSYALDIPLSYAAKFTYFLFEKEHPESVSTLDYELLESVADKLTVSFEMEKEIVDGTCDIIIS